MADADYVDQGRLVADKILAEIQALPPAERLRAQQSLLNHFDRRRDLIVQARLRTIRELRSAEPPASYDVLMGLLGLSKSRVRQLVAHSKQLSR
jgi:hypothetical protein